MPHGLAPLAFAALQLQEHGRRSAAVISMSTMGIGVAVSLLSYAIEPPPPVLRVEDGVVETDPPTRVRVRNGSGLFYAGWSVGCVGLASLLAGLGVSYAGYVHEVRRLVAEGELQYIEQYGPPDAYVPTLHLAYEHERKERRLERIGGGLMIAGAVLVVSGLGIGLTAAFLPDRSRRRATVMIGPGGLVGRF
jgi:hypothetical protein